MKKFFPLYLLMMILILASCKDSLPSPTPKITVVPSSTIQVATATFIPSPSATTTATVTPYPTLPTLDPEETGQTIAEFMKENNDCATPCFWGLIPGSTPFHEAIKVIDPLGPGDMWADGIYKYDDRFISDKLNMEVLLSGIDDELENIYASAYPLSEVESEDWLAFRPDAILRSYGPPSKIGVFFVETQLGQLVVFDLFYEYSDEYNFIIEYGMGIVKGSPATAHICPLEDQQIDTFDLWLGKTDLWLGKNLKDPPQYNETSTKIMTLSPEEFYDRMTGDARNACVDLNMKVAP